MQQSHHHDHDVPPWVRELKSWLERKFKALMDLFHKHDTNQDALRKEVKALSAKVTKLEKEIATLRKELLEPVVVFTLGKPVDKGL